MEILFWHRAWQRIFRSRSFFFQQVSHFTFGPQKPHFGSPKAPKSLPKTTSNHEKSDAWTHPSTTSEFRHLFSYLLELPNLENRALAYTKHTFSIKTLLSPRLDFRCQKLSKIGPKSTKNLKNVSPKTHQKSISLFSWFFGAKMIPRAPQDAPRTLPKYS